jgi:hypothetical protein
MTNEHQKLSVTSNNNSHAGLDRIVSSLVVNLHVWFDKSQTTVYEIIPDPLLFPLHKQMLQRQ